MRGVIILSVIMSPRMGLRAGRLLLVERGGSSAGAVLLDDAVHAGPMCDVCHGVGAEVPDAAVA